MQTSKLMLNYFIPVLLLLNNTGYIIINILLYHKLLPSIFYCAYVELFRVNEV